MRSALLSGESKDTMSLTRRPGCYPASASEIMDDVLTGSLLLLLASLAGFIGLWVCRGSPAATRSLKGSSQLCRVMLLPARVCMSTPAPQFGRWLARVKRASSAPSEDGGLPVLFPWDPNVGRPLCAPAQSPAQQ